MKEKKILVAIDYHEASKNAFEYSKHLAEYEKSELVLLHAFHIPVPALDIPMPMQSLKELESFENKRMQRLIEKNKSESESKIKINGITAEGLAGDVIPQFVRKNKPDLVVMGIHETSALDEFLFGSTCERIIYEDLVPVLIVPQGGKFKKLNKLTLATDLKDINPLLVSAQIKHYCKIFQSKIQILHIKDPAGIVFTEEKENLEKLEEELSDFHYTVSEPIASNISESILNEILKNNSRWIILIHKKYKLLKEIFHKSIIKKILFHSQMPILILNSGNTVKK